MGKHFLSFVFLFFGFFSLAASTKSFAVQEDWNFTPADYTALKKSGRRLTFSKDSDWFPVEFKKNLLSTLVYVLDEKLDPPSTAGVNLKDLYHGHIGCDGTVDGVRVDGELESNSFNKRGLNYYDAPDAGSLKIYKEAVVETENNVGARLQQMVDEKSCKRFVVVYHTYEYSGPGLSPGDPRRNLLTRFGGKNPEHYSPPEESNASSWTDDFSNVFQFAFLIDQNGVVHVTVSSTTELQARVMGVVPGF